MSDKNEIIRTHVDNMFKAYVANTEDGKTSLAGTSILLDIIQSIKPEDRETVLNRFEANVRTHNDS